MVRLGVIVLLVGLLAGMAGAAPAPPGRTEAVSELNAAIADERRALALLRTTQPRLEAAYWRIVGAQKRLRRVVELASTLAVPEQVENDLQHAKGSDGSAQLKLVDVWAKREPDARQSEQLLEEALRLKLGALTALQSATAPAGRPQCSDGKDNDRDGVVDWMVEPGCTSTRDVREQSPFSCDVQSRLAGGRLAVEGSCSGAFSEIEFRVLGDVKLNGRYDVLHASACGTPKLTGVRCTINVGEKNPMHLIDARFTTTSKGRLQRVQLRFFDLRKRQIGSFLVPSALPRR